MSKQKTKSTTKSEIDFTRSINPDFASRLGNHTAEDFNTYFDIMLDDMEKYTNTDGAQEKYLYINSHKMDPALYKDQHISAIETLISKGVDVKITYEEESPNIEFLRTKFNEATFLYKAKQDQVNNPRFIVCDTGYCTETEQKYSKDGKLKVHKSYFILNLHRGDKEECFDDLATQEKLKNNFLQEIENSYAPG